MNKKLVALAVAGACALPLTAQAQTANVTLYGRINMDAEVIINQKQDTSTASQQIKGNYYRVSSNSSRVGVRGDENLGGGLHAIFQVEERYDSSNSSNVTMSGDTYVGLQGGWGTLKIGYYLIPVRRHRRNPRLRPDADHRHSRFGRRLVEHGLHRQFDGHRRVRRSRRELDFVRDAQHEGFRGQLPGRGT